MQVLSELSFEELLERFERDHDPRAGSNPWALRLMRLADEQFGHWRLVQLTGEEAREIVLPYHAGEPCHGDQMMLTPHEGTTVRRAAARLHEIEPQYRAINRYCWQRIVHDNHAEFSALILSAAPLRHQEYLSLVPREGALYHLDGLHRLLAWERRGLLAAPDAWVHAYVAGLPIQMA